MESAHALSIWMAVQHLNIRNRSYNRLPLFLGKRPVKAALRPMIIAATGWVDGRSHLRPSDAAHKGALEVTIRRLRRRKWTKVPHTRQLAGRPERRKVLSVLCRRLCTDPGREPGGPVAKNAQHNLPVGRNVGSWDDAPLPDFNFPSPPIQPASDIEPSLHQPICSWGQLKLGCTPPIILAARVASSRNVPEEPIGCLS
jgi:hypothetical protein